MADDLPQWLNAKQITALPDMPKSIAGVHKMAQREGWRSQKAPGRGPGVEYLISVPVLAADAVQNFNLVLPNGATVTVAVSDDGAIQVCATSTRTKLSAMLNAPGTLIIKAVRGD